MSELTRLRTCETKSEEKGACWIDVSSMELTDSKMTAEQQATDPRPWSASDERIKKFAELLAGGQLKVPDGWPPFSQYGLSCDAPVLQPWKQKSYTPLMVGQVDIINITTDRVQLKLNK